MNWPSAVALIAKHWRISRGKGLQFRIGPSVFPCLTSYCGTAYSRFHGRPLLVVTCAYYKMLQFGVSAKISPGIEALLFIPGSHTAKLRNRKGGQIYHPTFRFRNLLKEQSSYRASILYPSRFFCQLANYLLCWITIGAGFQFRPER